MVFAPHLCSCSDTSFWKRQKRAGCHFYQHRDTKSRKCTSKSGSVSQSSPCSDTFTSTLWPTTDLHIWKSNQWAKAKTLQNSDQSLNLLINSWTFDWIFSMKLNFLMRIYSNYSSKINIHISRERHFKKPQNITKQHFFTWILATLDGYGHNLL